MAEQKKRGPGRPPGSKNKNSKKSNNSSAPKTKQEHIEEMHAQIDRERRKIDVIWSITILALGFFLLFTVLMNTTGALGLKIHDICLGLFGFMAYLLPFFFIITSILIIARKLQHISGRTATFGILIFINMCILNSARFIDENKLEYGFADFIDYYRIGVTGEKGGAFGMEFASLLVKFFGMPGLYIFALAALVISVFLVANTPISKFFEKLARKRESKRMLAELDAAEQAKVQMAVASTATPGADPNTGILPLFKRKNNFEDNSNNVFDNPHDEPSNRIIKGEKPIDMQDTIIVPDDDSEESDNSNNSNGSDAFDDFDNSKNNKDRNISYGLGNADEVTPSGSFGLGDYASFGLSNSSNGSTGLGLGGDDSADSDSLTDNGSRKRSRVINRGLGDETDSTDSMYPQDAHENISDKVRVDKNSVAEIDKKTEEELNAALNSGSTYNKYKMPSINLLNKGKSNTSSFTKSELDRKADILENTLLEYGVHASVTSVTQGASVTRFELKPATGVKVSSITKLSDDIALHLAAKSIRIEAPIPGKSLVGIEIENDKPTPVVVRDLLDSKEFKEAKSKISFAVGKDVSGRNIVADLKEMPHLLIAGATGSGKSVCVNTIIASILYKAKPNEVKLIMIDPKVVELSNYNGIPHMLAPVVTDPIKAASTLKIAVSEMNKRYELFSKYHVKDLVSYNKYMLDSNEPQNCKAEIVIIIDELADLMMASSSEVENSIVRLSQKARAAGMHLIVATQRPSVDVVTGLIKSNIPSRIALSVSSQVDSRTIIDMAGAEKLLGKGDMLFSPVGSTKPIRVQGPYITDREINDLIKAVKDQGGDPDYDEELKNAIENEASSNNQRNDNEEDSLTEDAIAAIFKAKQASVSMLQRRFRIGYNRAARIIDEIEAKGIIGPQDGARPRQLLMTEEEYYGNMGQQSSLDEYIEPSDNNETIDASEDEE